VDNLAELFDVFFNGRSPQSKQLEDLKIALVESVKLQSHYAATLNEYDGGKRIVFKSATEWLERLRKIGKIS
jgi:hypothetical protein